jgi:hypothetical protein
MAPAFTAARMDSGEPTGLEALRGTSLVLMIAAGGCHNCAEALPAVRETARQSGSRLVIACVGPRGGCTDYAAGLPRAADGEPGTVLLSDPGGRSVRAFGASSIPYVAAIDKAGRITATGGAPGNDGGWQFAQGQVPPARRPLSGSSTLPASHARDT